MKPQVEIYDTTLRDGSQGEGINFSVADKLRIAEKLDSFGVHYIEGGWPGSNPKDIEFFAQAKKRKFKNAKLAAFGRRRFGLPPLLADVIALTLDDAIDVLGLPEPDVLKIDVEGAEALVLRGGRRLLSTRAPALYIELHGAEPQREVLKLLAGMGYSVAGSAATSTAPEPVDAGHDLPLEYVVATRLPSQLDRMASTCGPQTT